MVQFEGKKWPAQNRPGHVRRSMYLKWLRRRQQRYGADADWHVVDGVYIGVTRRIRLNRAAAMLPHVILIWQLVIYYTVSQKKSHLWPAIILTHMNGFWFFFWQKCYDKVGNQKTLYYATSNNLCFGTTWQNAETRTSHISLNWIVLHTQCTCALSSCKKKITVICDVFDSV